MRRQATSLLMFKWQCVPLGSSTKPAFVPFFFIYIFLLFGSNTKSKSFVAVFDLPESLFARLKSPASSYFVRLCVPEFPFAYVIKSTWKDNICRLLCASSNCLGLIELGLVRKKGDLKLQFIYEFIHIHTCKWAGKGFGHLKWPSSRQCEKRREGLKSEINAYSLRL